MIAWGSLPPHLVVTGVLSALLLLTVDAAFRPRAWQVRRPASALRAQEAAVVVSVTAAVLAVGLIVVWGMAPGETRSRTDLLGEALRGVAAGAVPFGVGGVIAVVLGRGDALNRSDRAVHTTLSRLVLLGGYVQQQRGATTVSYIDTPRPFACATRDPVPHILITRGLIEHLTPGQVEAILAHEEHHLAARHDRHLRLARLAAACLPFISAFRAHERRVRLLIELAGDDHAARVCGAGIAAEALDRYCTLDPAPGAAERAARLRRVHARA